MKDQKENREKQKENQEGEDDMSNLPRPFSVSATLVTSRQVNGIYHSPVFIIPTGLVFVRPVIDVTGMSSAAMHLDLLVEVSFDGGTTWPLVRAVGRDGGDTATEASFDLDLPEPLNTGRRARVTITLTGGTAKLTTSVTGQLG